MNAAILTPMQVVLAICVSILLIVGQSLWKSGLSDVMQNSSGKIWALFTNVPIYIGIVVYIIATGLYMYVITKYKYGTSYALIVAFSLIGASSVSVLYFEEKISKVGLVGIGLILVGIILVVYKK